MDKTVQATCDICAKPFIAKRKRWWCEHCNKFFHVCFEDSQKDKIPCPGCGSRLKKKAEPLK